MELQVIDRIKYLHCIIKKQIGFNGDRYKSVKNYSQMKILVYLINHQNESVYQKDLCDALKLQKSSITEHLDYLESVNAIIRVQDENDKRKNSIKLSDKAINKKNEVEDLIKSLNSKIIEGISSSDLECFENVIKKMEENLIK